VVRRPSEIDHVHTENWTRAEQHRYEDLTRAQMDKLEKAVDRLTTRVTMLMGGIGLLVFVVPIVSPWIRGLVGVP